MSAASQSESRRPARTLYVQIAVDVESVLAGNPPSPGKAPVKVAFDPAQLIVTTTDGTAANARGVVTLQAREGDTLRFYAVSGSNNFEAAALISELDGKDGDPVLDDFALVELTAATAVPVLGQQPPSETTAEEDFWFWQASVAGEGVQPARLVLALYDRDDRGQPNFCGLYQWNLKFRVRRNATSTTGQNEEESL